MREWPDKRGGFSWGGQFSIILLSLCIWNLAFGGNGLITGGLLCKLLFFVLINCPIIYMAAYLFFPLFFVQHYVIKVCQWLAASQWFSPVSSTNKTDCHDITEILLKVTLNTIKQNKTINYWIIWIQTVKDHLMVQVQDGCHCGT